MLYLYSVGKESACNAGDPGSIPGLGRSAGEGISYPLQYSWASLVAQLLENPPAMQETWVQSLDWERNGYPIQYSGLENSMDCRSSQFSLSVVSDSLRHHGPQHARPPCPSPTPGVYTNSCPVNRWCHPTISSFVIPFSSHLQSFPASGSFPMSHFFTSGGQSIGVSASAAVLPMNIQDWFPLGWTDWISLQSKGLSRVFSNTTVQKHQFFGAQVSL